MAANDYDSPPSFLAADKMDDRCMCSAYKIDGAFFSSVRNTIIESFRLLKILRFSLSSFVKIHAISFCNGCEFHFARHVDSFCEDESFALAQSLVFNARATSKQAVGRFFSKRSGVSVGT